MRTRQTQLISLAIAAVVMGGAIYLYSATADYSAPMPPVTLSPETGASAVTNDGSNRADDVSARLHTQLAATKLPKDDALRLARDISETLAAYRAADLRAYEAIQDRKGARLEEYGTDGLRKRWQAGADALAKAELAPDKLTVASGRVAPSKERGTFMVTAMRQPQDKSVDPRDERQVPVEVRVPATFRDEDGNPFAGHWMLRFYKLPSGEWLMMETGYADSKSPPGNFVWFTP